MALNPSSLPPKPANFQPPIKLVRGEGSGRHVTRHWLCQQIASIALVPLSLYSLVTFFTRVVMGNGYADAIAWLRFPSNGLIVILLLGVAFFHGANGLSGIVEDYIHHRAVNKFGLLAIKCLAWLLALAGISSVLKVLLGA